MTYVVTPDGDLVHNGVRYLFDPAGGVKWTEERAGQYAAYLDSLVPAPPDPPDPPPEPAPQPLPLTPNALTDIIVGVIGPAAFVAAIDDQGAAMKLWRFKLQMARDIARDAPSTQAGLQALIDAGHMTAAQRDAVLAAWPMG